MFLDQFGAKSVAALPSSTYPKRHATRLAKVRASEDVSSKVPLSGLRKDCPPDLSSTTDSPDFLRLNTQHTSGLHPSKSQASLDTVFYDPLPWTESQQHQNRDTNGTFSSPMTTTQCEGPAPVPDKQLDVEQAISLLQELRKTATPDELVALHRALLPTRDVVPSPPLPIASANNAIPKPRISRRRTVMPPGLATRAGLDGDLLRKPEDFQRQAKPATKQRRVSEHYGVSHRAAMVQTQDLADDTASMAGHSTRIPFDSAYEHTGIYRHGTLRVTNRTSTPEPSVVSEPRTTTKAAEKVTNEPLHREAEPTRPAPQFSNPVDRELATAETQQAHEGDTDAQRAQTATSQPPEESSDKSSTQRVCKSQRQFSSENPYVLSDLDQVPTPPQKQAPSFQPPTQAASDPAIWSDVPRLQPQLHQSPPHLSQGHKVDYDIASSPRDQRGSVHDSADVLLADRVEEDQAHSTDRSAHEAEPQKVSGQANDRQRIVDGTPGDDQDATHDTDELAQNLQFFLGLRPQAAHHPDSGYSSDIAHRSGRNGASKEALAIATPGHIATSNAQPGTQSTVVSGASTSLQKWSTFARFKSKAAGRRKSMPSPHCEKPSSLDNIHGDEEPELSQSAAFKTPDAIRREKRKLQKPIPQAVLLQREMELQRLRDVVASPSPGAEQDCNATETVDRLSQTPPDSCVIPSQTTARRSNNLESSSPNAEMGREMSLDSEQRSFTHERCRTDVVLDTKAVGEPESQRTCNVSRARSKSLGRDVGRARRGLMHRLDSTEQDVPNHQDRRSAEEAKAVSDPLSKRRSVPTLLFLQHERKYQIQPGSSMAETKNNITVAAASKAARSRIRDLVFSDPAPPELYSQPSDAVRQHEYDSRKYIVPSRPADKSGASGERNLEQDVPNPGRTQLIQPRSAHTSGAAVDLNRPPDARRRVGGAGRWPPDGSYFGINTQSQMNERNGHGETHYFTAGSADSEAIASPTHDAMHAGWPGWEKQSELWRERRQAADATRETQAEPLSSEQHDAPMPLHHASHVASLPTLAYQGMTAPSELTPSNGDNRPVKDDVLRTDSAQSTATFHTVRSAFEQQSSGRPGGQRPLSTPNAFPARPPWLGSPDAHQTHRNADARPGKPRPHAPAPSENFKSLCDRYGGGLGFGWDRTAGFRVSAGTGSRTQTVDPRADGTARDSRPALSQKMAKLGQQYGVDLSDIPVFLRKV